jgi:hypothetical protein
MWTAGGNSEVLNNKNGILLPAIVKNNIHFANFLMAGNALFPFFQLTIRKP